MTRSKYCKFKSVQLNWSCKHVSITKRLSQITCVLLKRSLTVLSHPFNCISTIIINNSSEKHILNFINIRNDQVKEKLFLIKNKRNLGLESINTYWRWSGWYCWSMSKRNLWYWFVFIMGCHCWLCTEDEFQDEYSQW